MKLPGCEILGTAARTLAPLTNFPRAATYSAVKPMFIWEPKAGDGNTLFYCFTVCVDMNVLETSPEERYQ